MRLVSIDSETTGLVEDPNTRIIEFAAFIEDTRHPLPRDQTPLFKRIIRHPVYIGNPVAMAMNERIFRELDTPTGKVQIIKPRELAPAFAGFLLSHEFPVNREGKVKIIPAGKNVQAFDMTMAKRFPGWTDQFAIASRAFDVAQYYWDSDADEELPNLSLCKARAGFADVAVTHEADDDAWDVIRLIRPFYHQQLWKNAHFPS